ncbi:MAG: RNA 2',3'-cyclic phosphodiesterase [Candidatus Rifleibacteriota bacterium]
MNADLRLFYALEIPESLRDKLEQLSFAADKKKWKPVKRHQLHITLAFMGSVKDSDIDQVIEAGNLTAELFSPVPIKIEDTGKFPFRGDPRVWFARVVSPELCKLAVYLQKQLMPLVDNRQFRPHITLARKKSGYSRPKQKKIRADWLADSFVLFKSILTDKGPIYEALERFELV